MYDFTFHKAATLDDALAILNATDDPKLLAGGQTLIPTLKQRLAAPSDVIDISGAADLKYITRAGDHIRIGAMTTHADIADAGIYGMSHVAADIGDPAVRARGTIGGSIANNDPAADYPAALLALGATIVTNRRDIAADVFFTGLFETALADDEIIREIQVTPPDFASYSKFPNPASRYAMVGVYIARFGTDVRVAVTGAGDDGVFRHAGLETALMADWSVAAIGAVTISPDVLMSDIHASAAYRAHLIAVLAKRALGAQAG